VVQLKSRPMADLRGVVVKSYPTTQNDNGKWRPANFVIETESGEVKVKQFPGGHWDKEKGVKVVPEPISMPVWYNNLIAAYGDTLYALLGSTVQIKGEGSINPQTMEVEYTVVGENFVVLEDEALEPDEEVAALGKSNPVPVQIPPRPTTPPNTAILKPLDPNGRDVMIVDQVIFKGAVALRVGGAARGFSVEQAVADAIAVWDGVRARHFVTQETDDEAQEPDLESLESF
jgi:hypothetical protein